MRRLVPLVLFTALAGTSTAAPAPSQAGAMLRFMKGDCDRLALAGRSRATCKPQLVNLVYASGAVSFVFAGQDGRLLSFRSRVDRSVGFQTSLKVDQVTTVTRGGGGFDTRPARGTCTLTPFAVDRSRVDCAAKTASGSFAGQFRTSDEAPRVLTLASR
ncbi:hypothetical protein GCM10022281_07300 [Sphingomonas rosea]|uniref:Uncharacterized protein n=1 Tax=Sphingomonas rosea TaxID=335605 RepID=A0ABP7TSQ4_9SPHN